MKLRLKIKEKKSLSYLYAALAGISFALGFYTYIAYRMMVGVALGVFVLAALGGATIFVGFHLKERPLPIPLVIGHGLVAVTGFVLLLLSVFDIG